MNKSSEAVLLLTHFLDDRIVASYRRLAMEAGRDVYVCFNETDDNNPGFVAPPDIKIFSFEETHLKQLGYPKKGRHIRDTDIDLFSFPFAFAHPEYRSIWMVEYDVEFTAPWRQLFDAFTDNDADLLATSIHRHATNPAWENWKLISPPSGRVPTDDLVRAFCPLHRLSRRAYTILDKAYQAGWHGHYECVLPTVLVKAGARVEDIGGDGPFVAAGNRNRFYRSTPGTNDLSPGTFVFRPMMYEPGDAPGTLYHPVKPPATPYAKGWRTGRLATLSRKTKAFTRQTVFGRLLGV